LVALLSLYTYSRLGSFHDYGVHGHRTYHFHEIVHYYFGAKYYPELGYHRLYDCTVVALEELKAGGLPVPAIDEVRSLRSRWRSYPVGEVLKEATSGCHASFGAERWKEFRADLTTMVSIGRIDEMWKKVLFDLGLNPPPSWAFLAYPLANAIPLTRISISLMPLIDLTLIILVAGVTIFRAFGFEVLCAYLILLGNNWLADYRWIGGSFFRQEWFFLLAMALCYLKRQAWGVAGVFLGLASVMRIFPAFFAVGVFLSLLRVAWQGGRWEVVELGKAWRLALGIVAGSLIPVLGSMVLFGWGYWPDFFANILQHNHTYFVMHMGFDKIAVFSPQIAGRDFHFGAGLQRFRVWQQWLEMIYAQHAYVFGLVKGCGVAVAVYGLWRWPVRLASLFFGWSLLFFLNMPANYYYSFLALFALALVGRPSEPADRLRLLLVFLLLAGLLLSPSVSDDLIIQNAYANWWMLLVYLAMGATLVRWRSLVQWISARLRAGSSRASR